MDRTCLYYHSCGYDFCMGSDCPEYIKKSKVTKQQIEKKFNCILERYEKGNGMRWAAFKNNNSGSLGDYITSAYTLAEIEADLMEVRNED